jgi:hypothetical protein
MTLANVFLNNFNTAAGKQHMPHNWLDFEYSYKNSEDAVPASSKKATIFNSSSLNLDFQFDAANNNAVYKGNLKNDKDRDFLLWVNHNSYSVILPGETDATVFKPGRVLFARKKISATDQVRSDNEIDLQLIAYIIPETTMESANAISEAQSYVIKLNNNIETGLTDTYAKSLLNYRAHSDLQNDFLKAKIALVAMNLSGSNSALSYNVGTTASPEYKYCKLPLINNTFDVRFIRPIKLKKTTGKTITDAFTGTQGFQEVSVADFIDQNRDFEDFRGSWKSTNPNYPKYYAPDNKTLIDIHVEGVDAVGKRLSDNTEVVTDINASEENRAKADPQYAEPLYQVAKDLDFILSETTPNDVYQYRNNSATVGTFHVWIPVTVEYYWGTIYDRVMITIEHTPENGARVK